MIVIPWPNLRYTKLGPAGVAFGLEAFCDTINVGEGLADRVFVTADVLAALEAACGAELLQLEGERLNGEADCWSGS
jgi:hypothetical protein